MFREGRHDQKNKRRSKNMHRFFYRFFIDFPSKIDATSSKKHENRLCAQKSTEIHVWKVIFHQKIDFCSIFGIALGPWGPPGTSREPPRILYFLLIFSGVWKRARTVPRGVPRVPQGTPRVPFWVEFWIVFTCQKTSNRISNIRETSQKLLTKLERNVIQVCRGLNGGRPKGANDGDDGLADYQGRVIPFPILAGPEWWAPGGRQW